MSVRVMFWVWDNSPIERVAAFAAARTVRALGSLTFRAGPAEVSR